MVVFLRICFKMWMRGWKEKEGIELVLSWVGGGLQVF